MYVFSISSLLGPHQVSLLGHVSVLSKTSLDKQVGFCSFSKALGLFHYSLWLLGSHICSRQQAEPGDSGPGPERPGAEWVMVLFEALKQNRGPLKKLR